MSESPATDGFPIASLHLRAGWWALLLFLSLGLFLESLHGFKVGWYLDVSNATRREMWTLAHAHGTLVSLINIVFGLTCGRWAGAGRRLNLASRFLLAGSFLLPVGFFLGGLYTYDADPGLGILLVPPGGVALFVAVFLTAFGVMGRDGSPESETRREARVEIRRGSKRGR